MMAEIVLAAYIAAAWVYVSLGIGGHLPGQDSE